MPNSQSNTATLLHTLARSVYQQDNFCQPELHELTVLQSQALKLIKVREKISMGELAEALQITPASTTALIDRLIKTEWVMRQPDLNDRRLIHLVLVPEKRTELESMLKRKYQRLEEALAKLTDEERTNLEKSLISLLTKLNPS